MNDGDNGGAGDHRHVCTLVEFFDHAAVHRSLDRSRTLL